MNNRNFIIIILIGLVVCFIGIITINKFANNEDNNKPSAPIVEPEERDYKKEALTLLKSKLNDIDGNYTFVEIDNQGNYVFSKEGDDLSYYVINLETEENFYKPKPRAKGAAAG